MSIHCICGIDPGISGARNAPDLETPLSLRFRQGEEPRAGAAHVR